MVKVILGSALGGLVAGGIALMAAGQMRATTVEGSMLAPGATTMTAVQTAAMPALQCAPHQEPAMQRVIVNGQEAAALACVDRGAMVYYQPAGYPSQGYAPAAAYPVAAARPAVQTRTAPVRERVVYREPYEPDVRPAKRSVAKTAMIIGGSAGTGAGIGAIAGGKKGALIGAAIGGGAASIWEATKR